MRRSPKDVELTTAQTQRRALLMGGAMAATFAVLGVRMRSLTVEQGDTFKLLAEENRIAIRLLPPARGLILDRNGKVLAANEQNFRVVITREDAGDVDAVLAKLAHIIPLSADDIERTKREMDRTSPFAPVTVTDRLTWEELSRVALNTPTLPGITPEVGLSRLYPRDTDFAHVVGYVGPVSESDLENLPDPDPLLKIPKFQIGKIGVERWMEEPLRGAAGTRRIEVNAQGRVMRELERIEGDAGRDLRLTIDADVQNFVQARLGTESAAAVIMDVVNGDLIAIASAPSFDPNLFVRGISHTNYNLLINNERRPLANKSVQGTYPPGSTFKMITALAALREGQIDVNTTFNCPGHLDVAGRRFHCWKRGGHGRVDLEKALAESCDVFFYEVAQMAGIDKISETGRLFGLGQRFDLPMSAVAEGLMPSRAWKRDVHKADWRIGDTINASIGQGYVLTSPLQLAVMTARLATGRAVVPRLVRSVDNDELHPAPAPAIDISEAAMTKIRRGMYAVINTGRGTAYSSRIDDEALVWAGKTGTSQVRNISAAERAEGVISNDDLPWNRRDHALFVGYAPFGNPRYAVSVIVEHGGGGSLAAAPIARDIILRAMSDGLPPLSAYPAAQRNRIETQMKELRLRDEDGRPKLPSRA